MDLIRVCLGDEVTSMIFVATTDAVDLQVEEILLVTDLDSAIGVVSCLSGWTLER